MKEITLTYIEKKTLENGGFYVKEVVKFNRILMNIPFILLTPVVSGAIIFFPFMIGMILIGLLHIPIHFSNSVLIIIFLLPWIYSTLRIFYDYIFFGKLFFYKDGPVIKELNPRIGRYWDMGYNLYMSIMSILIIFKSRNYFSKVDGLALVIFGIIMIPGLLTILFPIYYGFLYETGITIYIICGLFIIFVLSYFLRSMIEVFHPLYAFGNIGEKIQKLTPQIETQSKLIQSGFGENIDFQELRTQFDVLARTLSKIMNLVLKLEGYEKRANKGNLFDSEKYINSLRSDIIEPLISLRGFLETQRSKLISSQKILTQVRIGGPESAGNTELQSKRSESLIGELNENIKKLDGMIEKIG